MTPPPPTTKPYELCEVKNFECLYVLKENMDCFIC